MLKLLLGLSLVTLDALWLGAWLRWLAAAGRPGSSPPGLVATITIGAVAFIATRLLLSSRASISVARVATLALGATTVLLIARMTLYGFEPAAQGMLVGRFVDDLTRAGDPSWGARMLVACAAFLWWRGIRYGRLRVRPVHVRRSVGLALSAFALVAVATRYSYPVDLAPWILGALALSLVALALVRIEEASRGYGGTTAEFGPVWVGALFTAVAAVALLAVLLAPVLSIEAARAAIAAIKPLPEVIYTILALLVLKAAEAIFAVIASVYELLSELYGEPGEMFRPNGAESAQQEAPQWDLADSSAPKWILDVVRWGLVLAGALVVATILGRALRRYEDREEPERLARRESDLTIGRIVQDLAESLRSAMDDLSGAVRGVADRPSGVRALYGQLLRLMADQGLGRRPSQTPYEYEPRPSGHLPESAGDIGDLTSAYVLARYGEREPDGSRLAALQDAWHRIRRSLERRQQQ
jgi:hypothetical protein